MHPIQQPDIPSSELVRNLIFLGTTGSGKSTTCNTLYGNPNGPFPVGHDEISCTSTIVDHVRESKRIRLIDTPGFNDNRFEEKTIENILGGLTSVFLDRRVDSTKQVDAFVLVVKMNPRAQTLKEDLLRVRNLFGIRALRSLVLLVIQRGGESRSESQEFLEKLKNMKEVVKILEAGKQEEANEDWFCLWDNVEPRPGQEEQLMGKMRKLEPYTSRRFLEAELEEKEVIDTVLKEEITREVENYKDMMDINRRVEGKEMERIREKVENERKTIVEARDNAVMNMSKVIEAVERMNDRTVGDLEKLYRHMVEIREEREGRYVETMGSQKRDYWNQLEEFLRQNREILKKFEEKIGGKVKEEMKKKKVKKVENKEEKKEEKKEHKTLGQNIMKMLGLAGRGGLKEKKEALEETASKGAETAKNAAKEGAEAGAKGAPKDVAKEAAVKGVKEVAKKGAKVAATKTCNIF